MPANVTTPGAAKASPLLSSNALPIGTRIHEFEITRVIGEGGFSVVYLAFDHTLHRSIALKEYIPSALASRRGDQTVAVRSAQHQQTFEAGLRSFINEARLLAQFDHPALVKVFRFWEANGTAYMAMPYYEGRTLRAILREHPEQASEAWLKRLLVPLLDALALLHAHRCYHRDIAPDNIQVLDNEQPVLLDFGAARRTIGDMTQAFTVILKPGYAPIEQYAEETDLRQGPWTDVYALAAVLYGAIVGKPPPTAVARVIRDPIEPLVTRNLVAYDPMFLSGIDRGLAVRPEARPQSIGEWRGLLGMDVPPTRPGDASTFASWGRPSEARAPSGVANERTPGTGPVDAASGVANAEAPKTAPAAASSDDRSADEASSEADRTILVPGLRRPPATASAATSRTASVDKQVAATGPSPAQTREAQVSQAVAAADPAKAMPRRLRPATIVTGLVGLIVVAAVVAWLALARPSHEGATSTVVTNARNNAPAAPSAPAPSTPVAPVAPVPAAQPSPPVAAIQPSPPPVSNATTSSKPAEATNTEVTPAPTTSASSSPAPAPVERAQPESKAAGTPATHAEAVPEKAKAPAIPEDERRWAALRNSDNIDDLRAFRQRFPQSRHAQEAAVRIQQLMRQARESTREAAAAPQAKSAESLPAKRAGAPSIAKADEAARRPQDSSELARPAQASPGTVRIRVQPFGYVYVDGALVGPSPPAREVQLSPGKHQIEARNDQENPPVVRKEVNVTGAGPTEVPLRFGQ